MRLTAQAGRHSGRSLGDHREVESTTRDTSYNSGRYRWLFHSRVGGLPVLAIIIAMITNSFDVIIVPCFQTNCQSDRSTDYLGSAVKPREMAGVASQRSSFRARTANLIARKTRCTIQVTTGTAFALQQKYMEICEQ